MRRAQAVIAVAVMLALAASPLISNESEADGDSSGLLIDMGNGTTYWCAVSGSGTYLELAQAAAESLGLEFSSSGSAVTRIGDMSNHSVGTQSCSWLAYKWSGTEWVAAGQTDTYDGTAFAFGFYPDHSVTPVETPDDPTAWIQYGGTSSLSGVSDSYGTASAVTPVEWYNTYTTGYVDSSIVAAGGYLYHTTNGAFYGSGTDAHAWLYCLDADTGAIVWSFDISAGGDTSATVRSPGGYDITTPVIIGDMIVVMSSNQHSDGEHTVMYMYCLDRVTGELLDSEPIIHSAPLDSDGNVAWTGRTFVTGGTTPVYDSGALYFGTSDGRILCYSVSRDSGFEMLWECVPPSTSSGDTYTGSRGCFYFHAPLIADVDGERTLFIGNYEGYLFSIDADTGTINWARQLINLGEDNTGVPGTPGSVASMAITDDGRLIVECTDGAMVTATGFLVCVDASTGQGPDGSEYYWRLDGVFTGPIVDGDCFYVYGSASATGSDVFPMADGTEMDIISAVYKFNLDGEVVWVSKAYPMVKASPTLADGILYFMDYSAGGLGSDNGCLMAISAEDGSQLWRYRLEPYSDSSYSMVSPTVIDGKIYVGNDYGAVYCISTVAGPSWSGGSEIVLTGGLEHWSWIVLILVSVAAIVIFWRLYRGDRMTEKRDIWNRLKTGYRGLGYAMSEPADDDISEISRKKRRFTLIVIFGIIMSVVAFLISISISSGGIIPVSDAIASMFSAIGKGGENLNTTELYIYQARLPRAIAAIAVGAGLAIAGCMYQAIIRNPLVDPYITGVSSGAGCFAIAITALGVSIPFVANGSLYLIPVAAIIGGLIAFAITMAVAEGSGGSATNYILAGVIVGFAFSSVQTIFLSLAKDNLTDTMWWLYGSFANITWENAWIVFIPALGLSLLAMIWAREFNLFSMGEDQAKQLGLNVVRFKRSMLIIASVLTSFCVAFCGIIGFVGLIIPHACRMALGSDYRLVMPASIVLGAMLMLFADLIARTVMSPIELPVGAITAMIGTPIFAYMLMRKGREYDG